MLLQENLHKIFKINMLYCHQRLDIEQVYAEKSQQITFLLEPF